jgi:hypothetical protein
MKQLKEMNQLKKMKLNVQSLANCFIKQAPHSDMYNYPP